MLYNSLKFSSNLIKKTRKNPTTGKIKSIASIPATVPSGCINIEINFVKRRIVKNKRYPPKPVKTDLIIIPLFLVLFSLKIDSAFTCLFLPLKKFGRGWGL